MSNKPLIRLIMNTGILQISPAIQMNSFYGIKIYIFVTVEINRLNVIRMSPSSLWDLPHLALCDLCPYRVCVRMCCCSGRSWCLSRFTASWSLRRVACLPSSSDASRWSESPSAWPQRNASNYCCSPRPTAPRWNTPSACTALTTHTTLSRWVTWTLWFLLNSNVAQTDMLM